MIHLINADGAGGHFFRSDCDPVDLIEARGVAGPLFDVIIRPKRRAPTAFADEDGAALVVADKSVVAPCFIGWADGPGALDGVAVALDGEIETELVEGWRPRFILRVLFFLSGGMRSKGMMVMRDFPGVVLIRFQITGQPGTLRAAANDVGIQGIDPEVLLPDGERVVVVLIRRVEEVVHVAVVFVVSAGGHDGKNASIFRDRKLPIIEPIVPFAGNGPVDHVTTEADEERTEFGHGAVGSLARVAVIPAVTAGDEGEWLVFGRCRAEPESWTDMVTAANNEVDDGIRLQFCQANEVSFQPLVTRLAVHFLRDGIFFPVLPVVDASVVKGRVVAIDVSPTDSRFGRGVVVPDKPVVLGRSVSDRTQGEAEYRGRQEKDRSRKLAVSRG